MAKLLTIAMRTKNIETPIVALKSVFSNPRRDVYIEPPPPKPVPNDEPFVLIMIIMMSRIETKMVMILSAAST